MVSAAFNLANVSPNFSGNAAITTFLTNVSATPNTVTAGNVTVTNGIQFPDGTSLQSGTGTMSVFDYTGDGSTVSYSTGNYTASTVNNTWVFVGGVYQRKNQYNWSGSTLTFTEAPPNGANVEIQISTYTWPINTPSPASVQPSTLSTGGPSWDVNGNLTVTGNAYVTSLQLRQTSPLRGNGLFLTNTNTMVLATNGNTAIYMDPNQFVGVGTTTPSARLSVGGNLFVSNTLVFGDGSTLNTFANTYAVFNYTGNGSQVTFSTSPYNATSVNATQVIIAGVPQRKNQYSWSGTNLTFTEAPPFNSNIEITVNTIPNVVNAPSDASVTPPKLSTGGPVWDVSGNFGIGTSVPASNVGYYTATINGSIGGVLQLQAAGTNSLQVFSTNSANYLNGQTSVPMLMYTSSTERMRIDAAAGNVGIGTSDTTSTTNGSVQRMLKVSSNKNSVLMLETTTANFGGIIEGRFPARPTQPRFAQIVLYNDSSNNGTISLQVAPPNADVATAVQISSGGYVTMPLQPAFFVGGGSGTITTAAGGVLQFTSVDLDRTSSWNTGTYRFTAPVAGLYFFHTNIYTQNAATQVSFCWRKNGTQLAVGAPNYTTGDNMISYRGALASFPDITQTSTMMITLAASDYIDYAVRTGASSVQWYPNHSWIMGYLVS